MDVVVGGTSQKASFAISWDPGKAAIVFYRDHFVCLEYAISAQLSSLVSVAVASLLRGQCSEGVSRKI